ncbi:MAG: hypothetical protein ACU0GG_07260 [Paracoccaceae bacterium]
MRNVLLAALAATLLPFAAHAEFTNDTIVGIPVGAGLAQPTWVREARVCNDTASGPIAQVDRFGLTTGDVIYRNRAMSPSFDKVGGYSPWVGGVVPAGFGATVPGGQSHATCDWR